MCVCYSGLRFDFGEPLDTILDNHVEHLLGPLVQHFGHEAYIAFSTHDASNLSDVVSVLSAEVGLSADRLLVEARPASRQGVQHIQYVGIEHCGRMIQRLAARRSQAFAFAVRMRYDVLFAPQVRPWTWRIWNASVATTAPVATLAKYRVVNATHHGLRLHGCPWQLPARRCVPQDVFFIVRNTPSLGPVEALFLEPHTTWRHFVTPSLSQKKDRFEATMFQLPLSAGAPFDVHWMRGGHCSWMFREPPLRAFSMGRCDRLRSVLREEKRRKCHALILKSTKVIVAPAWCNATATPTSAHAA